MDGRELLLDVVRQIQLAADAGAALRRSWREPGDGPVFVLGIGKASAEMARAALELLGDRREVEGIVLAPSERAVPLGAGIEVLPVDHPQPTARNVAAAERVRERLSAFTGRHQARGSVCALISGGASSHLTLPAPGLTLDDLRAANRLLQRAGCTIDELNAVRKHTEQLKGGALAKLVNPARTTVYVLSDVRGDALDVIASGPFWPDPTTYADALAVLGKYGLVRELPAVVEYLRSGELRGVAETLKPGDGEDLVPEHVVIANNEGAVRAAAEALHTHGLNVRTLPPRLLDAEARNVALKIAKEFHIAALRRDPPIGFVCGGEPVVSVGSTMGLGGPSQELACALADQLSRVPGLVTERLWILTYSTDGIDGPTDAAGAIVPGTFVRDARAAGVDVRAALEDHDTYRSLDRFGYLIKTGPTGTNVNHVCAVVFS